MNIEKLLEQGKCLQIQPRGYSMYPLIVPGRDGVFVEKAEIDHLKPGDVVLFRRKGSILVLHRICKKKNNAFFLVGDNQKEIEGPVFPEQIKGKMTGMIRNGHRISTRNIIYIIYSKVWLFLRPVRPLISRRIHSIRKRL